MRTNLEDNLARRIRHNSASYGTVHYDLTGTYVIASDGPTFHFLDGGAAARTVYLPILLQVGGQQYFIVNRGASAVLNVVTSAGVAVATLGPSGVGVFISSAFEWKYMIYSSSGSPIAGTAVTFVSSPYTVLATDQILYVDTSGGAVTILLQTAAIRAGVPLSIKDVSGDALTNNVTVTPNGAETIDGLSSYVLNFAYAGVRLNPRTSSYTVAP